MDKYIYYILSGENESLSEGELKTLLNTYDRGHSIECNIMVCIVKHTDERAWIKISERAANVREVGEVDLFEKLEEYDDLSRLVKELGSLDNPYSKLYLTVFRGLWDEARAGSLRSLLEMVRKPSGKIGRVIISGNWVITGTPLYKHKSKTPYLKVFDRSIAITPRLARTLINLSGVKEGDVILDPFVGTGTIILEAFSMGILGIGVDIDWSLINGFAKNLNYNKYPSIPVLSDSTKLEYTNIDAVVTDPPYGRGASTKGLRPLDLVESFLVNAYEGLSRRGGRIVFMAPSSLELDIDDTITRTGGLIKDKFYTYVHSDLGRLIYVVEPL
ncbi:TRM11 family SAM-dependent methyltransferase [Thermogladius sp. 4427co]|uniref:TRM11 family SAM-dependent methyltransferase n=1 Tax=Thermogladius sp. 4427co TaxID=3450718 RepID=UPI003F7AF256